MKIKLLIICLLLVTSQVFGFQVTSTNSWTSNLDGQWMVDYHITLDDLDGEKLIRCMRYNKKNQVVGMSTAYIFGIGKITVGVPKGVEETTYRCIEKK